MALAPGDLDAAWAAGFIDGEGCLSLQRQPRIDVSQRRPTALYKLKALFGGGIRHDGSVHRWYTTGSLIPCLKRIVPFLVEKSTQGKLLLNYCRYHARRQHYNPRWLSPWDLGIDQWYARRLREEKK